MYRKRVYFTTSSRRSGSLGLSLEHRVDRVCRRSFHRVRLDEIAAPIENRDRDNLLVLLGPCGTLIHQSARAGARDDLDVSRQWCLLRGDIRRAENHDEYVKPKQANPN